MNERHRAERLMNVHVVCCELSTVESVADLCRQAVEMGTARLEFERLGIWFTTDQPRVLAGTFGTDENGNVRDERNSTITLVPDCPPEQVLRRKIPSVLVRGTELYDGHGRAIGTGTLAVASLWDGKEVIGYVSADNLLSGREMDETDQEVLTLYASALGHLCSGKQAEEALRASEEQYRTLVENVPVGIYRTTPDGRVLAANAALLSILGYSSLEELRSRNLEEHGFAAGRPRSRFKELIERDGRVKAFQSEWIRRDGSAVSVRENAVAVGDGDGNTLYYEGMVEDITDQKEAQEALARRDKILEAVAFTAESFLAASSWEEKIPEVLARLGGAAEADVAYVFYNHRDQKNRLCASQLHKWFAPGVEPREEELEPVKALAWEAGDYKRWARVLGAGEIIAGRVKDLPPEEQPIFLALGIRSLVVTPIFCGQQWWGIIGFEDRTAERAWSPVEIDPLKAAAGALGAAIQRQQAEEALRDSEKRYRTLISNLPVGVLRTRVDGSAVVMANPAAVEIFGYDSMEDLLSARPIEVYQDSSVRDVLVKQLLADGQFVGEEGRMRRKDGTPVWVGLTAGLIRNEQNEPEFIDSIVEDITVRKMAEDALKESEEKYRTLVESASDVICMINSEGEILFLNAPAAAATGRRPKDFVGKTLWNLFPRDVADRQAAGVREVIRTGKGVVTDSETAVDGQTRWYQARGEPIRDHNGEVTAVLIIARDVTDQKQAEADLRAARARIDNAREQERRRLAGELHDSVGQGLVALRLTLQNAVQHGEASGQADLPEQLAAASENCRRLVQEIRDICHGLYPPTLESLGLVSALKQLVDDCQGADVRAEARCGPEFLTERFGQEVEIALFRIAQEAVNNALRHGQAGHVSLELDREDGDIVLTITDDGTGFAVQDVPSGGLGLNMMRERAAGVGGELRIVSRPGRTQVQVTVPGSGPPEDATSQLPPGPG